MFGFNEFAGNVTRLAVQKQESHVCSKIVPHHRGLSPVSRGWSISAFKGHVLDPSIVGSLPRQRVDLFMDRVSKEPGKLCVSRYGVHILNQCFDKVTMLHGDPNRDASYKEIPIEPCQYFINWLGESQYMHGLTTIPPSRFSNTNSNGLWEYSPFLCVAGLLEALDQVAVIGLHIWTKFLSQCAS